MKKNKFEDTKVTIRVFVLCIKFQCTNLSCNCDRKCMFTLCFENSFDGMYEIIKWIKCERLIMYQNMYYTKLLNSSLF